MSEVLEKTGQDLFMEILRIYETAEYEDYFKGNMWKNDLMKTDYVLLDAHRKEAGAPDPPALEDVELPEGISKLSSISAATPFANAAANAALVAGGPVAELRLIALFVAKWKLDPTKTKALVAKLTPNRRRYVIQNFKSTAQGDAGVAELETFIAECGTSGVWDKAGTVAPLSGITLSPVTAVSGVRPAMLPGAILAGLKRPIATTSVADMAKKLRVAIPSPSPPVASSALALKLAAARAQGGLRPPTAQPVGLVKPQFGAVNPVAQPKGALIRNLLKKF